VTEKNTNTIYLVRHGENRANITHEFSYKHVDYPLTPKGVLQARQTAEYFKDRHIDEIYASPLKRAQETASIIAQTLDLPVTVMEQFREINVGSLEGRAPSDENWELHNRIVQAWFEGDYNAAFPDGENYLTLLARLRAGLLEVTRDRTGQHIVIVGHGGIFTRTIRDLCPGADITEVLRVQNYNCAVTRIKLLTANETVTGTLEQWAYHGHLHGEAAQVVPGTALDIRSTIAPQQV